MHILPVLLSTALAFASSGYAAPAAEAAAEPAAEPAEQGAAWAKDGAGVWTANNRFHRIPPPDGWNMIHEACTRMNTQEWWMNGEPCAYWTNDKGGIFRGHCKRDYFWSELRKVNCV